MKEKILLILRTVLAVILNLIGVVGVPFFLYGIPMSISLDMGELVWIWAVLALLLALVLALSIRMLVRLRRDWRIFRGR